MAGFCLAPRIVGLFILFLGLQQAATARSLLSTSASPFTLKDTSSCQLATSLDWKPPLCVGGPLNCLVSKLPSHNDGLLKGICNSTAVHYCSLGPYKFAVGVKAIPPYGPTNCESCTCRLHPELKTSNKARCDCDPLPPCYVSTKAKVLGKGCPYETQSQCVITKPFGAKVNGVVAHLGKCVAPQDSFCVSGGPTWGPLFYAIGAKNVPQVANRCLNCICKPGGTISSCTTIKGCTRP